MYVHQRGVVAYQRLWWCSPPAGMVGTCNPMLLPQPPAQQCKAKCRAMSNPSDYAVVLDVGNVFGQAWGTSVDVSTLASTVAPQIFAFSIFPYAGFLYCLTKSSKTPPIALGGMSVGGGLQREDDAWLTKSLTTGFYFLLAFVFATIPAGIYAKQVYGTTLANVDWLHGGAESLLTVTNLLVRVGCV